MVTSGGERNDADICFVIAGSVGRLWRRHRRQVPPAVKDLMAELIRMLWPSSQDLTTNDGDLNAARWRMRAASEQSARKFFFMLLLSLSYFLGEMVFGVLSGSLAVLADAFHMLTDVAALVCGYWVAQLSLKEKTAEHSFGWKRAEIVGALCNG